MDFTNEIELGIVGKPALGHEPTNELWLYHMNATRLRNKMAEPYMGTYDDIEFKHELGVITARQIRDFGIKSLPGYGAFAFYTLLMRAQSFIVTPIHKRHFYGEKPTVVVRMEGSLVTFVISSPKDKYECYRIEIMQNYLSQERIVYGMDGEATLTMIVDFGGLSNVVITGYSEEISIYSEPYETELLIGATIFSNFDKIGPTPPKQEDADAVEAPVTIFEGIQKYVIEEAGIYYIEAQGAAGGRGSGAINRMLGGFGAILSGEFELKAEDELYFIVGQKGTDSTYVGTGDAVTAAGGGATTVVVRDASSSDMLSFNGEGIPVRLLICAGAGNGGGDNAYSGVDGANALINDVTTDEYLTVTFSGGGYRNANSNANCGNSFLSGGKAATYAYTRASTTCYPGFGSGGSNTDDGAGGGGGGYRGGVRGKLGGSSFNTGNRPTAMLNTVREGGQLKILKIT